MSEADYSTIGGGDFPPDARTLVFRGINGTECEHFVRSVRFIALAEGQDEDDRWMLRFATARLAGKALRWHARLDKDIRKDWDLLVQALLDQYPVDGDDATAGVLSSSGANDRVKVVAPNLASLSKIVPDAPNLGPGLHMGRIRIIPKDGPPGSLYLAIDVTLTSNQKDAMHVQFLQSDEPHGISILELRSQILKHGYYEWESVSGKRLAVARYNGAPLAFQVHPNHSPYTVRNFQLSCWLVSSDLVVQVTSNNESNSGIIQTHTVAVGLYNQECIFVADFKLWAEEVSDRIQSYYEARFLFEPISYPLK